MVVANPSRWHALLMPQVGGSGIFRLEGVGWV
jgi:hypothetical protein